MSAVHAYTRERYREMTGFTECPRCGNYRLMMFREVSADGEHIRHVCAKCKLVFKTE